MLWDVLRMTWPAAWARREPRAYQTESSQALSGKGLSSHGFVKNLKGYGREAGPAHIHLHQTRHTYARMEVIQVTAKLGSTALKGAR